MGLRTRLFFDVGALAVTKDALGSSHQLGSSMTLLIPGGDGAFDFSTQPAWRIRAFGHPDGGVGINESALYLRLAFGPQADGRSGAQTIAALAVEAELPQAQKVDPASGEFSSLEELNWYREAIVFFARDALVLVRNFVRRIRTATFQHWLDVGRSEVEVLRPAVLLSEAGALLGEVEHVPLGAAIVIGSTNSAASLPQVTDAASRAGGAVPISDLLLLDAVHWAHFESITKPDNNRVIFYAAMATEVAVKDALKIDSQGNLKEFVTKVVDNPKVSLSASELWDTPCLAVYGKSLRLENKTLFADLQKLFEARNQFVHLGKSREVHLLQEHVRTAVKVIAWLRSIRPSAGISS